MKLSSVMHKKIKFVSLDWRNINNEKPKNNEICGVKYDTGEAHIQYYVAEGTKGKFKCFQDECMGICPDLKYSVPVEWASVEYNRNSR